MPTDPLTGSRYPASSAAPNVPQDLQNAVYDLSVNTNPRFATTAARDAAYAAYTAAGGVLANGRMCWTDDVGQWQRIGGAWVQRFGQIHTTDFMGYTAGWGSLSTYYAPGWHLYKDLDFPTSGRVILRGTYQRTGGNVVLPIGTPVPFGTIPSALAPVATISPISWAALGSAGQTYPVRIYIPAGSTTVYAVGMDSGSGTFFTTAGLVNVDGIGWVI